MKELIKKFIFWACLVIFAELFYYFAIPHWIYPGDGMYRINQRTGELYDRVDRQRGVSWVKEN